MREYTIEQLITYIATDIRYRQSRLKNLQLSGTITPEIAERDMEQMKAVEALLRKVKADKGLFPLRNREDDAEKADRFKRVQLVAKNHRQNPRFDYPPSSEQESWLKKVLHALHQEIGTL